MESRTKAEAKIEVDETLVSSVKEALLSEGWKPPARRRSYSESDTVCLPQNSSNYKGKKNPLGNDGKPFKCFRCQSEYHMVDKCDKKTESKDDKKEEKKGKEKRQERQDKKERGVSNYAYYHATPEEREIRACHGDSCV